MVITTSAIQRNKPSEGATTHKSQHNRITRTPVKLLLLGQSGSGKTTTLKHFKFTYAHRDEWAEERAAWRPVVFLNLVRNINLVVEHLSAAMLNDKLAATATDGSPKDTTSPSEAPLPGLKFTDEHQRLCTRLQDLVGVQLDLERRLGLAPLEIINTDADAAPLDPEEAEPGILVSEKREEESFNHWKDGWKAALGRLQTSTPREESSCSASLTDPENSGSSDSKPLFARPVGSRDSWEDDIAGTLNSLSEDIKLLWQDSTVQEVLERKSVWVQNMPGFFLDDSVSIASRDYRPADEDVLRAHIRTVGIQELKFTIESAPDEDGRIFVQNWYMYEVAIKRSSRAVWYSYFDDADAVLFLAPLSVFDEKVPDEPRMNRLEESYLFWGNLCSCDLLTRSHLILLLNKCHLLDAKLKRGIQIRDSVPSYGTRANDFQTATKYFQQHFKEIARRKSPVQRPFYMHLTSEINSKSTAVIMGTIEECILREHLRRAEMI
ncbi:guanine nucleotide binding protein, alpha subunit [Ephemerocybe angulata]|uniref:Guanine nucleotide binding protein, alpha subunit n=1 Tax=Ephemerocybe angulata TaxID=980116 RepID=A0A8H6HPY4_9AGAR|nr:guanine nucleotide binding protein, alpha subunit [Tulosesus angulatus]